MACIIHRDHREHSPDVASVSLAHCLIQIAACAGVEPFLSALESALRQGRLSAAECAEVRAGVPASFRALVDVARSDADSGLETLIRYRLHLLGIECASQVRIPGVGWVDLLVGDCLIIEADGATHAGEGRHRDLVRDAVAAAHGFVTLRFDAAMILHDWPTVEAAVLGALARGRHESDFGRRIRSGR